MFSHLSVIISFCIHGLALPSCPAMVDLKITTACKCLFSPERNRVENSQHCWHRLSFSNGSSSCSGRGVPTNLCVCVCVHACLCVWKGGCLHTENKDSYYCRACVSFKSNIIYVFSLVSLVVLPFILHGSVQQNIFLLAPQPSTSHLTEIKQQLNDIVQKELQISFSLVLFLSWSMLMLHNSPKSTQW